MERLEPWDFERGTRISLKIFYYIITSTVQLCLSIIGRVMIELKRFDHFGCIGRHSFVPVLGSKDEWWIGWQVILQQDVMEDLSFNQLSKGSNGHRIIFNSVSLFWTFALELLKNSKLYVEQDFFVLERHSNDVFYNFSFLNSIEYSWKKLKKFFRCLMNSNAT